MKFILYFLMLFSALALGENRPIVMLIGGIHGDEVSGVVLLKELLLKPYSLKKGSIHIIPEANKRAVDENKRTPYYMEDLNRAFPGDPNTLTGETARDVFEKIRQIQPDFVVDFHESYYNFDGDRDPRLYIGNTIIANRYALENMDDFFFEIDYPLLSTPVQGSLIYALESLGIPGIVLETCREESLEKRVERGKDILIKIFKYLEMELEQ